MKHTRNPFPVKLPNGAIIINERCACGCLRTDHHDTVAFGHGACGSCDCVKFSWRAHVTSETQA